VDEIALPSGRSGRLWLAGKHAVAPDPEALLRATGATAIVCLNQRHELTDRYPQYVAWLEQERDARAWWFPMPDLGVPPVADAVAFVAELRDRLDDGAALVVHCGAGIGRAGTLAACVLVAMGVSEGDALAAVAAQRPMAGPEAGVQRQLVTAVSEQLRQPSPGPRSS
jgi:protein-tyrosine phosphatase